MAFGLTENGFVRKDYDTIRAEREASYKSQFLSLYGYDVDTSQYSPIGVIIDIESSREDLLWQQQEALYYGWYVDTAEGASLDRAVAFKKVVRFSAERSIVTLTITGTDAVVVPIGRGELLCRRV